MKILLLMCLLIVIQGMPDAHKRRMASTLSGVPKRLKSLSFYVLLYFYASFEAPKLN